MAMPDAVYNKFVAFARMACRSADFNDSDAIQFNDLGELGDADHNVGRIGRAVCITDGAAKSRAANNKVRGEFLTAIMHKFGKTLDDIPKSVKDVLNIRDYGLVKHCDGSYEFTSGHPLTVRRICQVMTAVNHALCDAQDAQRAFDELWAATQVVAPGQRRMAREQAMAEVLAADPLFAGNGRLNLLGRKACSAAEKVFRDRLNVHDAAGRNEYLRDYGNKAREAAEFVRALTLKLHASVDKMLPKAAPDAYGNLRRRLLLDRLTSTALERIVIAPTTVAGKTERKLLAHLKEVKADLQQERQSIGTAFEMTLRIADKIAKDCGLAMSEEAFEAQVCCLLDAGGGFISAMDGHTVEETHAKREADFVQMFKDVGDFVQQDKEKALKVYGRLLRLGVSKVKYMPGAVELAYLFAGKHVALPEDATTGDCRKFLEDLQKATLKKGQEISHRFKEFGSDDIHQLQAAFITLLMAAHPEFVESVAQVSDDVMADLATSIDFDTSKVAATGDNARAINLRALEQMALALDERL